MAYNTQIPGYITYFSPGLGMALQVAIYFDVEPNKTYKIQYTTDGVTWIEGYTFTAVPGQKNHSAGVTPAPGALWPRLLEVSA